MSIPSSPCVGHASLTVVAPPVEVLKFAAVHCVLVAAKRGQPSVMMISPSGIGQLHSLYFLGMILLRRLKGGNESEIPYHQTLKSGLY